MYIYLKSYPYKSTINSLSQRIKVFIQRILLKKILKSNSEVKNQSINYIFA